MRNAQRGRALPLWLMLLAAGGIFGVTMGVRQSLGLFLGPINTATGLGLASVSLAFAVGQLWWGLAQPFAGMVADRYGPGRVLAGGVVVLGVGAALIPLMHTTLGLVVALGLMVAGGAGAAGPSVLMATVARLAPPERRGMASGMVNAGGSMGQFLFVPIAQGLTSVVGWASALPLLGLVSLVALPGAWLLRGRPATHAHAATAPAREPTGAVVARALRDPSYRLLAAGFFVCGFHVAFLATHLPGVVASCGLPPAVGAWSLSVIGLFNIAGSFGIGWAIGHRNGRWPLKSLLSALYAARGVGVLLFLLAPKTTLVFMLFAAFMGVTLLSTVPPTAGLVAKFFGAAHMGTLFGIVMVTHQVGGFLGAYLGGRAVELTGSYDWMWYADIALAAGAALVHLPIREPHTQRRLQPA